MEYKGCILKLLSPCLTKATEKQHGSVKNNVVKLVPTVTGIVEEQRAASFVNVYL